MMTRIKAIMTLMITFIIKLDAVINNKHQLKTIKKNNRTIKKGQKLFNDRITRLRKTEFIRCYFCLLKIDSHNKDSISAPGCWSPSPSPSGGAVGLERGHLIAT